MYWAFELDQCGSTPVRPSRNQYESPGTLHEARMFTPPNTLPTSAPWPPREAYKTSTCPPASRPGFLGPASAKASKAHRARASEWFRSALSSDLTWVIPSSRLQEYFAQSIHPADALVPYSANQDDETLHELYLWPFAEGVRAGAASFMCSCMPDLWKRMYITDLIHFRQPDQ